MTVSQYKSHGLLTGIVLSAACFAAAGCGKPASQPAVQVFSRGATRVEVVEYKGESFILVFRGKELAHRQTLSIADDLNHGWEVVAVQISTDGRRVAYQVDNLGGHQPYRSPVTVVDVHTGKAADVEHEFLHGHARDYLTPHNAGRRGPALAWKDNASLRISVCDINDGMTDRAIVIRLTDGALSAESGAPLPLTVVESRPD